MVSQSGIMIIAGMTNLSQCGASGPVDIFSGHLQSLIQWTFLDLCCRQCTDTDVITQGLAEIRVTPLL